MVSPSLTDCLKPKTPILKGFCASAAPKSILNFVAGIEGETFSLVIAPSGNIS